MFVVKDSEQLRPKKMAARTQGTLVPLSKQSRATTEDGAALSNMIVHLIILIESNLAEESAVILSATRDASENGAVASSRNCCLRVALSRILNFKFSKRWNGRWPQKELKKQKIKQQRNKKKEIDFNFKIEESSSHLPTDGLISQLERHLRKPYAQYLSSTKPHAEAKKDWLDWVLLQTTQASCDNGTKTD